ncbi:hypothetical protein ACQP00_39635 [Dactylosporangium sp. CS-047395]|uniref:hypothetical protein n=1 Tax=Dactylosporangium sp. CS-047395 TaxID=3239936 RepID=UPI003D8DC683
MIVALLLGAAAFGGLHAAIAAGKNRDPPGWFLLGALFGVFSLIAICALPALPPGQSLAEARRAFERQTEARAATGRDEGVAVLFAPFAAPTGVVVAPASSPEAPAYTARHAAG